MRKNDEGGGRRRKKGKEGRRVQPVLVSSIHAAYAPNTHNARQVYIYI